MKNQRDRLHQYQKKITVLTDKETDIAKQMLAKGDKQRALLALRRKKYQESLLVKTDAQLLELEKLTSNVEFALIQKDVVFGLQQGTKVLKEIHAEMGGIEHVEKLMGETADAIAYQQVRSPYAASNKYLQCYRKSVRCSEEVYRTTMKRKSKMNSQRSKRRWHPKSWNYPRYQSHNNPWQNDPTPYKGRTQSDKRCWRRDDSLPSWDCI